MNVAHKCHISYRLYIVRNKDALNELYCIRKEIQTSDL